MISLPAACAVPPVAGLGAGGFSTNESGVFWLAAIRMVCSWESESSCAEYFTL